MYSFSIKPFKSTQFMKGYKNKNIQFINWNFEVCIMMTSE